MRTKIFLTILAPLFLFNLALSQNILIIDYNNAFSSDQQMFGSQIFNYLSATRPSVTRVNAPPATISNTFDQVWLFGNPGANTPANLAPYINYVNGGGGLYLQSEVGCCNNQAAFAKSLIDQLVIGGTAYQHNNTISGTFDYQPDSIVTCNPFTGTGTALRPFIGIPPQNRLFGISNICTTTAYNVGMAAGAMFASCDMISGQGAFISLGDFNMMTQAAPCAGGGMGGTAVLDPNPVDFIANVFPGLLNCQYKTDTLDIGDDSVFNCSVTNFTIQSNITNPAFAYSWSTGGTGTSITVNAPGTYYLNVTNTAGCTMTDTIVLTTNNNANQTINYAMCPGDTYNFRGTVLTTAGTYYDTVLNPAGCDSLITLNLSVQQLTSNTINQIICQGDSYPFGGTTYTATGTYYDTILSSFGCDSVANTLNLTVVAPTNVPLNRTICTGGSYNFNGTVLTNAGTYYDTLVSIAGCDSITYQLTLAIAPLIETNTSATICSGQTYSFAGQTLTQPGTYHDTTVTSGGCDSATHLTLNVNPSYNIMEDTLFCTGDSIFLVNTFVSTPGIHTFQLTTVNGCDSIVNFDVTEKTDCHLYIFIPNSFTPDNNNVNEYFRPVIDGEILDYEFFIFNRWGETIYYSNDVEDDGWDGFFKSEKVKTGVYVWEIRYKDPQESGTKMKHGHVKVLK